VRDHFRTPRIGPSLGQVVEDAQPFNQLGDSQPSGVRDDVAAIEINRYFFFADRKQSKMLTTRCF